VTFLQEILMISPSEVVAMKKRPSWPGLLASIESSIRQDRALAGYRFDPKRMSTLNVPTLLLTGSETASPQLKQAISGLLDSLPNRSLFAFEGQQHNATGHCSATVRRDGWELLAEHDKQNTHKH